MKVTYYAVPLLLLSIVVIISGCTSQQAGTQPATVNGSIESPAGVSSCEQVISLNDIKNTCSPDFLIKENKNDSYYVVPNETNTISTGYNRQIQILGEDGFASWTMVLLDGTVSLCKKAINNGVKRFDQYNNDSRFLDVEVYKYNSSESAKAAYSFFNNYTELNKASTERTAFEQGNTFGSNYTLSAFPGGEEYDRVYNQTYWSLKSVTLQFLKGKDIITITSASEPDKPLICTINQTKALAGVIDKRL